MSRLDQSSTMTEPLTDEKLIDVAEAVADDKKILKLGVKLGFQAPTVRMYISTNKRNDSFEGTSSMLFDWKMKTPRAKQIPDIIKALSEAGFAELVDDFFPSGEGNPEPAEDAEDFDEILVTVAKGVRENSDINTLGSNLGFPPEDVQRYIATNYRTQNITWDGTLQMLRDWRKGQRSSTEREALKTALEKSGQIRLADKLFSLSNQ